MLLVLTCFKPVKMREKLLTSMSQDLKRCANKESNKANQRQANVSDVVEHICPVKGLKIFANSNHFAKCQGISKKPDKEQQQ